MGESVMNTAVTNLAGSSSAPASPSDVAIGQALQHTANVQQAELVRTPHGWTHRPGRTNDRPFTHTPRRRGVSIAQRRCK